MNLIEIKMCSSMFIMIISQFYYKSDLNLFQNHKKSFKI